MLPLAVERQIDPKGIATATETAVGLATGRHLSRSYRGTAVESRNRSRKRRTITTSDIARLTGLSRTTVSAVLNGKRNVRESTRAKVMNCIRENNFNPGLIARTLVGELSQIVAVLASAVGSPFQMMMFRGINSVLEREQYHLLFHNVKPEDQDDPETLASLMAYRPAGYIILKGAEGRSSVHARRIAEEGIPLVSHGRLEGLETHSVNFDNRRGMRLMADYVMDRGHRRVAHLAGPIFSQGAKERKLGFMESLVEHHVPYNEGQIVDAGETAAEGYLAARELLKDPKKRPTAIVCFNDMVAMGVYRAAHELGLDIPRDLSVTGFDGVELTEMMWPPLTTLNIFPETLGQKSAELLLKVIRNQVGRGFVTEWVDVELIERGSVRPLADAPVVVG